MKKKLLNSLVLGFISFWLPLLVIIHAFGRLSPVVQKLSEPLKRILPWGIILDWIIFILLILIVSCFFGWIVQKTILRVWAVKVNDLLGSLFPGYMFKRNFLKEGNDSAHKWKVVAIEDDGLNKIGFLIEERDNICVVFFPGTPDVSNGEIACTTPDKLKYLPNISFADVYKAMRRYGDGITQLQNSEQIVAEK